ncbi:MAG: sigma-70 family RNA polymerase sigma factor [Bacilli bacterium]|jgi:RNA polymerase sigma factor (sigma-70 family)|nr:sigma-70 family RNA polymerase sigma factor [Bacilli bacterium]
MSIKIHEVEIFTKSGEVKTVKLPIDEELYKAIKTLEIDSQRYHFALEYYDHIQERKYQRRTSSIDEIDDDDCEVFMQIDSSLNPEEFALENEKNEIIRNAVNKLNSKQREVVVCIYFKEMSQRETALEMGVQEAAVSKLLDRALAKLKEYLDRKF